MLVLRGNLKKEHFFPVFKVLIAYVLVFLQTVIVFRIVI